MAVLRRLGAASGRKMNFDGLCVCVCMSRTGCSSVKDSGERSDLNPWISRVLELS